MSASRIKWGILGTSPISEVMAKAIQESTLSQLHAIGSRSALSAKHFAERFSIPKAYSNYHELLLDKEIDAVYIGLPNHLHKEWIIRAAEANKHILCEKPFVITAAEAHEVIAVLEKSPVFCMEALMYRYHPFIQKLQELIQENVIGDIKLYNATYTANIADRANPTAGGSIRNLGCYPVSLVRLLANMEPIEINSFGRMNVHTNNDNQASAILKFANNSMAVVSTADDIEMFWQFDIYGTEGNLKVESNPWLPDRHNNKIVIKRNDKTTPTEIFLQADKSLYTYQIDALAHNIFANNPAIHNEILLRDSLGNITVLDNWLRQVKAG